MLKVLPGVVDLAEVRARDVVAFVGGLSGRYRPRTVELVASLGSFFRFLRAQGIRQDRLEDAVPMVPHRSSDLVRHPSPAVFEQLIASLDSATPRGLRSSELVQLGLEDLDWDNATVRVQARKTGHSALLPLTDQVDTALAEYLEHARPDTAARQVFVLPWLRVGEPVSASIVGRAVGHTLDHDHEPRVRDEPGASAAGYEGCTESRRYGCVR